MLPIMLDNAKVSVAVVGEGAQTLRRLQLLARHGVRPVAVFAPKPDQAMAALAGTALVARWPGLADLKGIHVLFAGDLDAARAQEIAVAARGAKTLLNVEDQTALCDVQMPAAVRRGDLVLTASTGGRAPGLARKLAAWLDRAFGPEWEERLSELAAQRLAWRAEGLNGHALSRRLDQYVEEKGWL